MKSKGFTRILLMGMCAVAGALSACHGTSGDEVAKQEKEEGRLYDSLVTVTIADRLDHALTFVDSLEAVGVVGEQRCNYYRAVAYYKLGQEMTAEVYCTKALEGNLLYEERPALFYHACDLLSTVLTYRGDKEGSLIAAKRGFDLACTDKTEQGQHWTSVLLHDVGYSQMLLDMVDEAENNFSLAYIALKQIANTSKNYDDLYTWARVSYNIVDAYTSTERYDKAAAWIASAEEAVNQLVASPECTEHLAMQYREGLLLHKAMVLVDQGKRSEADEAYSEVVRSGYANTNVGILDCSEFLRKAGRWSDLADLMPRVDSLAKEWKVPLSLYYLKSFLVPQFDAYVKSGRRDEAMATAVKLAGAIDSVDAYERETKMEELAILTGARQVQDTAGEREETVSYRWALWGGVLLLLLVAGTVAVFRRRTR